MSWAASSPRAASFLRQPLGRYLVQLDIMRFCRRLGVLYIDTVVRP
ncbi:MAG: hypothetical protein R3D85_16535 [Paracoccaceae bacterium]